MDTKSVIPVGTVGVSREIDDRVYINTFIILYRWDICRERRDCRWQRQEWF